MALILKQDLPSGVSALYWRVIETNIHWGERRAHVTLAGYVSKEARNAGRQPIVTIPFDWQGDDFPFKNNLLNPLRVAYTAIKQPRYSAPEEDKPPVNTNPFTDAKDDTVEEETTDERAN